MKTALWCIALAIAFAGLIALAILKDSPQRAEFTDEQRVWLTFERPRGHFVGNDRYVYCDDRDGGRWVTYWASGDWTATERACWIWLLPRGLR